MPIRPWPRLGSTPGPDLIIFRAREDLVRNPRTGQVFPRLILETPGWVNVLAQTADGSVIVVRQYRFGTGEISTEIPGGMIEPGEDPLHAAQRELREETGYVSEHWVPLGFVEPNPAFHDNRCWHFWARDAVVAGDLKQDPGEDLEVDLLPPEAFVGAIKSGDIRHSLVISAASRVFDLRW